MPYGLIPDGYTLKKITKQEEDALNVLKKHENVEALLKNSNTPLLVGAVGLVAFTPLLTAYLLDELQKQGVEISETLYDQIMAKLPYSPPALFAKAVQGAPDLWDSILKKDAEFEAYVRGLLQR
jgi:hypothetical protein